MYISKEYCAILGNWATSQLNALCIFLAQGKDFTFFELSVGLSSMIVKFAGSRLRFHSGLCSIHHQGELAFQDYAVSGGKPRTAARSSQKVNF